MGYYFHSRLPAHMMYARKIVAKMTREESIPELEARVKWKADQDSARVMDNQTKTQLSDIHKITKLINLSFVPLPIQNKFIYCSLQLVYT